jgi:hypothetical protein
MKLTGAFTLARSMKVVGVIVAVAATVAAVFLWQQQVKVEPALQYKCDLAAFVQVKGDECLDTVPVPVNRKFSTIADRADVEGQWTTHPVAKGELAHPSQLTKTPPDRFRFTASGSPLPVGVWGHYLPVPAQVLEAVKPDNLLTLVLADGKTQQLIVIFDKATVLDKASNGVYLGLTMDQIAAAEKLNQEIAAAETSQSGKSSTLPPVLVETVWTISQGANPSLPPLGVFKMELSPKSLGIPAANP